MTRRLLAFALVALLSAACVVKADEEVLARCADPADGVAASIQARITNDQVLRRFQAVSSDTIDQIYVSAELVDPQDSEDDEGDILTWAIGADGSTVSVDEHAREQSDLPFADDVVADLDTDGFIESRTCVDELRPPGILE